jgi:proline dehydrogenase
MTEFHLDFQDTETAFAHLSNKELKEKHRMFLMLNSPFLNGVGTRMAKFALSLGLPVEGMIKRTIYEQFCGGETIEESNSVVERLGESGIGTILDYAVEGRSAEADFDATKNEIIRTIERAKDDPNIPFAVFKVTGIAPFGTLERLSARKKLDAKSQAKAERIHARVETICSHAHAAGQPIFIDAEYSWLQDATDRMATEMMERFNREIPIVFNTIQLYRTDRLQYLRNARKEASKNGYWLGMKFVRGAYLETERERATEKGYPSPVHADKSATDEDYNAALEYGLKHLGEMAFVNATHNEESTQLLARRMNELGLPENHPRIFFSQLYGMGDNISYVLAKRGYNVSKYVPYGPVADAIPYLIRRAEENTSAAGHMSRQLEMITRELRRRKLA